MLTSYKNTSVSVLVAFSIIVTGSSYSLESKAVDCFKEDTIYCGFSRQPDNFTNLNGAVFFTANDGINGIELWKSDGTQAGTTLVKDIKDGKGSSLPSDLTIFNGSLYFKADDGTRGSELWKSDGTVTGTLMVKDIVPGAESTNIEHLIKYNNMLFFSTTNGEIWKSDGTEHGTELVSNIDTGISGFTEAGGLLYFITIEQFARVFRTDGSASGTLKIHERTRQNRSTFYQMSGLGDYAGKFIFHTTAYHGDAIGFWIIDAEGNLDSLTSIGTGYYDDGPGYPSTDLIESNGNFYISVPSDQRQKLLVFDGTENIDATQLIEPYQAGFISKSKSGVLVFVAADYKTDRVTIWKSEGTNAQSMLVKDIFVKSPRIEKFNLFGSAKNTHFYSVNNNEIWKTDGTELGTVLVKKYSQSIARNSFIGHGNGGSLLYFGTQNEDNTFDLNTLVLNHETPAYEDAEDGSTSRWTIFDQTPAGAAVSNIFDSEKQSQVIQLKGSGIQNGYKMGSHAQTSGAWDNTSQTLLDLDLQATENFSINLSVDTSAGRRHLIYQPIDYNLGPHSSNTSLIRFGLGSYLTDGQWQGVNQDLEVDLKIYEPNNNILSVNGIFIRGNLRVDNIALLSHVDSIIEDAENGTTFGWLVHDANPQGASMSNVFDLSSSSRVIHLAGISTQNAFRLGHHHSQSDSWQNTSQKTLHWDMRFTDNFGINITVKTPAGQRFLSYHGDDNNRGVRGPNNNQFYLGLGTASKNGQWQTYKRNLETDLQLYEPDNTIISVNGMFVRGNGDLDNIKLSN